MANRRLGRMAISPELLKKIAAASIHSPADLFKKSKIELVEVGLYAWEVDELYATVSRAITPEPYTVYDKLQSETGCKLSLGPASLQILNGALTEFVGGPGMGKTQACLSLSVMATLPEDWGGLGGGVVYIDTESTFSPSRLVEIARCRFPDFFNTAEMIHNLTANVRVFTAASAQELLQLVKGLEEIINDHSVKLVVVDSIAAPVRMDYDSHSMPQRQVVLAQAASSLKHLAQTFGIPIVVTNQVMSNYSTPSKGQTVGSSLSAALGVSWAHAVNTRFVLQDNGAGARLVTVGKSPLFPQASFPYLTTEAGFQVIASTPLPLGTLALDDEAD